MRRYALVMDLGGSQIRAAVADRSGRISHRRAVPTLSHLGRDDVVERLLATLREVAGEVGPDSLVGLGAAVASPTEPDTGIMRKAPSLPGWDGFSLRPVLEAGFPLAVSLANDATLATLGEHLFGAGRGYDNVIYLTVSTGIGGGVVAGGKLYTGAWGFAGELGHMTIDRNGPRCNCGNVGCLEVLASGGATARMAMERLDAGEASVLRHRLDAGEALDARQVAGAAEEGDGLALNVMREAGTNLGRGIVSIIHAFDPDVVVVGGGMSNSFDLLRPWVLQEIERHAMPHQRGGVEVVRSRLGDDAGLIGAGILAFEAHREDAAERVRKRT